MIPLDIAFWIFVLLFALMGALRGWGKEILVTFSIIVALSLRLIFSKYVPFLKDLLISRSLIEQFYIYSILVILMAIAGYAGPVVSARLAGKAVREKLQDFLLGFFIGALNGYLIVGSVWYFLHLAGYGVLKIEPPAPESSAGVLALRYLPLQWMTDPWLLTIFVLAAVFLVIVLV